MRLVLVYFLLVQFAQTSAELPYCYSSEACTWKAKRSNEIANNVSAIAGHRTKLVCDAYRKLSYDDECSVITIQWLLVNQTENVPRWEVLLPAWSIWTESTLRYTPYVSPKHSYNVTRPIRKCVKNRRMCGVRNVLHIAYADLKEDANMIFICRVSRNSRALGKPSDTAYSAYRLKIESCPELVKGKAKKNGYYRGGPCHHGKCVLEKRDTFVLNHGKPVSLRHSYDYLTCKCLPGYGGPFCKDPTDGVMKKSPYNWMLISWLPIIVGVIAFVIAIIARANGRVEIIFREAEILSPFVKIGAPLKTKAGQPGLVVKGNLPPLSPLPGKMDLGDKSEKSIGTKGGGKSKK